MAGATAEGSGSPAWLNVANVARKADAVVENHWRSQNIEPAALCTDAEFARRVTLDALGRVPTLAELRTFLAAKEKDKRRRLIERLVTSREFSRHMAVVFDDIIQGQYQGDEAFLAYLRHAFDSRKPWNSMFQELLVGPWSDPETEAADRFLRRRLLNLDQLTADTARVFFGVNISCAQCHDHPLAPDWTQDHYYGLQSFLARTYEHGQRNRGVVGEKSVGEVEFVSVFGDSRKARLMFFGGQVVDEPIVAMPASSSSHGASDRPKQPKMSEPYAPPPFSAREQLVRVALDERRFFSRAVVNRLWEFYFGQGVVHPSDQMHSDNPPSIEGLLDVLADDFIEHGYALDRLAAAMLSTRVYQRSSRYLSSAEPPAPEHFAFAQLRPLTPQQLALSLVLVAGEPTLDTATEGDDRYVARTGLEDRAKPLVTRIDPRTTDFQSSTTEALFMSNNANALGLFEPTSDNLAARMARAKNADAAVSMAAWTILGRAADDTERARLSEFLSESDGDLPSRCAHLAWALANSAEFRFNH